MKQQQFKKYENPGDRKAAKAVQNHVRQVREQHRIAAINNSWDDEDDYSDIRDSWEKDLEQE